MRTFAAEQGVAVIDVEAACRSSSAGERYFFNDQYHPNREGAEFIAATVAQAWR